jgi:hypothetical protein
MVIDYYRHTLTPCWVIGPELTQRKEPHLLYHSYHFLQHLGFSWTVSKDLQVLSVPDLFARVDRIIAWGAVALGYESILLFFLMIT